MIDFFTSYWPEFVSGTIAIAGAVVGIINAVNAHKFKKYLDDAKKRETYTVCPYCKKKIPISELHFHLPTGQLDDDLNGLPD